MLLILIVDLIFSLMTDLNQKMGFCIAGNKHSENNSENRNETRKSKKTQAAIFSDNKKNVGEKLKYQTPDLISKNMKPNDLANSRHEFLMIKNHFF